MLLCPLFSLRRTTEDASYRAKLQDSPENLVGYWVEPSNDPYSWRGMALQLARCPSWEDVEKWRVEFDAEWRSRS